MLLALMHIMTIMPLNSSDADAIALNDSTMM